VTETTSRIVAERRCRTYWTLSEIYLQTLSESFLERLRENLGSVIRHAGDELPRVWLNLHSGLEADGAEGLAVEHTRLLGGLQPDEPPGPPYETVHRGSRIDGEVTLAVSRAYSDAGFGTIHADAGPQDHLGVELRFMSLAAHQELEAWSCGNGEVAMRAVERQREFLEQHLLAWAPAYCRTLSAQSRTAFHRALGELTERVLIDDHALLRDLLTELEE